MILDPPRKRIHVTSQESNTMIRVLCGIGLLGVTVMTAFLADAFAFDPKPAVLKQPTVAVSTSAPRPKAPEISPQALFLIRSTLSALNDANRTGNYTVLRDLAAPSFQAAHSPADLALVFADLRRNQLDLSAAALLVPRLTAMEPPEAGKPWQLAGYLPTEPRRVIFDLRFDAAGGHWRLSGASIGTTETPAKTAAAAKSVEKAN